MLARSFFAAAFVMGTAGDSQTEPNDDACVCSGAWQHDQDECVTGRSPTLLSGCPSLDALAVCEVEPQVSWCKTTAATCKQQQGDAVGQSWVMCDAETQKPELPHCSCGQRWDNQQGNCAGDTKRSVNQPLNLFFVSRLLRTYGPLNSFGYDMLLICWGPFCAQVNRGDPPLILDGMRLICWRLSCAQVNQGCPTLEALRECVPDYSGSSWCFTKEVRRLSPQ